MQNLTNNFPLLSHKHIWNCYCIAGDITAPAVYTTWFSPKSCLNSVLFVNVILCYYSCCRINCLKHKLSLSQQISANVYTNSEQKFILYLCSVFYVCNHLTWITLNLKTKCHKIAHKCSKIPRWKKFFLFFIINWLYSSLLLWFEKIFSFNGALAWYINTVFMSVNAIPIASSYISLNCMTM